MADQLLTTDVQGQIGNPRWMEIPIQGPGKANRLLILSGIANVDSVYPDLDFLDTVNGQGGLAIRILTDYSLNNIDHLRNWQGILNGNAELQHATYVALCDTDIDVEGGFAASIESVWADISPDEDHRVQIHCLLTWFGDVNVLRFSYQTSILLEVRSR